MKKSLKYIVILFLFMILGVFIGFIFSDNNLISGLVSTYVNPFTLISLFLLALLLSTGIHEITHAIYFILKGMKLRYIAIFIFCLYKSNKHYKFTINTNNITLFGGIVIPEIPVITSEQEMKRVQNIYSNALLAAPLISLFEAFLLITVLFFFNNIFYSELPELFCFIFFNILVSITIFISSFIKTENLYGDFPAFKRYRFDDKFATIQLMQYMFFNTNWKKDVLASKWLIQHIINQCHAINKDNITIFDIDMLDLLLNLDRMNFVIVDNKLTELFTEIFVHDLLFSLPPLESRNSFYYHLLYFLFSTKRINKDYIINKYKVKEEKICFINKNIEEYYKNLTQHIIFQKNNKDWLINNIFPNSMYRFLRVFESIKELEISLINKNDLEES